MQKKDIVLIKIPFTDLSEAKLRPALILGHILDDYLCCFISSNVQAKTVHDVVIKKNVQNKLKVDSIIKCGKLFTLHWSLIEKGIGTLSLNEYKAVIKKIMAIIK